MAESAGTVLVVDDDEAVGTVLHALLQQAGMTAEHVLDGAAALRAMTERQADVVLTDLRMPGMGGLELMAAVHATWPGTPVIVLTAHGSVPLAVEAMRAGAADFLLKPFDREQLVFVVHKALLAARHAAGATAAATAPAGPTIARSPAARAAWELVRRAAGSSATVLLRGESGTGKELAARALHDQSPRAKGPFVVIHCAALPDALLEGELFGYEKGAFTGATCRKPGRIELAAGGTIFLDEIGDVPLATQVKLLRVLQERTFERLGGTETLRVDARFVAATHQDLEAMVRARTFREDLFYRLSVVPIALPPLRDRPEDVEPLVDRFVAAFGAADGRTGARIDAAAVDLLRRQPWPGNVRQLQNFVERLVVLTDGPAIRAADVERELARNDALSPSQPAASAAGPSLDARRREAERHALREALDKVAGNRTLAARILGVSRRTLYNMLEQHGVS